MDFKKIKLEDFEKLKALLSGYRGRICDISPANLVFWRDWYDISYWSGENAFAIRFGDMDDIVSYYCTPDRKTIDAIINHEGAGVCFSCLTEEEVSFFTERYKCRDVRHSEDWDDYLYASSDIITLKGKKYNGQRNHINKFNRLYPNSRFEEISKENVAAVKEFCYGYFHDFGIERAKVAGYEEKYLYEQLDNLDVYSQHTGVLFVNDKVVGFSIGETVGDTLIIHTEKANIAYEGVYPKLVQTFAGRYAENTKFINREEDCGEAGLRISKRSYHPVRMLGKYSLIVEK